MGAYGSRNRAWVYIAFYDEYANRHMAWAAGVSITIMIPMYWYGIFVNRSKEQVAQAYIYSWTFMEKRSRLCHNMIMEHFEVHSE